jgi:hypothetical protein
MAMLQNAKFHSEKNISIIYIFLPGIYSEITLFVASYCYEKTNTMRKPKSIIETEVMSHCKSGHDL